MKQSKSISERVVMNTGILYVKMGITMFISLYTTRLILNSLGASDFGIFNIVGGVIAMLGFLNTAMAAATQRFMSYAEGAGDKDKQKNIFNVSVILHFFIALLVGIIMFIASCFFFNGILNIPSDRISAARMVYCFMIISTMLTVMTVPYDAILNAHENMFYYAIVGIVESILKLVVAFVIVYTITDKLVVYGALMASISLFVMIIMRVYCHRNYVECEFKPKTYYNKDLMREMTRFAGWNFLGTISSVLGSYGLGIVINIFYGTIANATQGIAMQISGQLGVLGSSIKKALNPIIVKSAGANDRNLMIKSTIWGTKIIFFVVSICFLPIMVELPYVLKIWLINPPLYASLFCQFLLITNLLDQLVLFLPQAIAAIGRIKEYQMVSSILNIFSILIVWLEFSIGYPAYTIYITTAFVSIIKGAFTMYFAQRICGIAIGNYFQNIVVRCSISFIISFCVVYISIRFFQEGFLRLIITVFFSIIVYTLMISFVGFNKEEQAITLLKLQQAIQKTNRWRICKIIGRVKVL